jgi:hypothetical protein
MEMRRLTASACVLNQSEKLKSHSERRAAATCPDFFIIGEGRKLNSSSRASGAKLFWRHD